MPITFRAADDGSYKSIEKQINNSNDKFVKSGKNINEIPLKHRFDP